MHPTAARLGSALRLPAIGAPMFIVSTPDLVVAQCNAGIIGAIPALNARSTEQLDGWLPDIARRLRSDAAPCAVNLIAHRSNARLSADLEVVSKHRVPVVITSLSNPEPIVEAVHAYGGLVLHDVASVRHARKASASGVDGLILLCAGAGGQTGSLNPFAFVAEVRSFFDGPLVIAGSITRGRHVMAARMIGADFAYIGTPFIAAHEANASEAYRRMVIRSGADDVLCTAAVTGVPANYLIGSFEAAGLDPQRLPRRDTGDYEFGKRGDGTAAWSRIWSAGHGVGQVTSVRGAAEIVESLVDEYAACSTR